MTPPSDPSGQRVPAHPLARVGPAPLVSLPARMERLIVLARRRVAGISDSSGEVLSRAVSGTPLSTDDVVIARRTSRQYERVFRRFLSSDPAVHGLVGDAPCARTHRAYVAAVRAMIKRRVSIDCDELQANPDAPPGSVQALRARILGDLTNLRRLEAERRRWEERQVQRLDGQGTSGRGTRRVPRKRGLLRWGEDADERLWAAAEQLWADTERRKLAAGATPPRERKAAVALLLLAGVRPAEFEQGIAVAHLTDDKGILLRVTIKGSKCKATARTPPDPSGARATVATGQPMRTLTFRACSDYALYLARLIEDRGGADIEVRAKAKAVCDAFRRVAKRAFPNHRDRPSAYHCRHELSAELRSTEDTGTVARAMGHASTATQQCYGSPRRRGRKRDAVVEVQAAMEPRASAKTRPMPTAIQSRLREPAAATRAATGSARSLPKGPPRRS